MRLVERKKQLRDAVVHGNAEQQKNAHEVAIQKSDVYQKEKLREIRLVEVSDAEKDMQVL